MDQITFKQKLRDELAIPADLDTAQRIAALEKAFLPFGRDGRNSDSALAYLTRVDELDFFGPLTLRKAFGWDLDRRGARPCRLAEGEEWMAGLRRRAYRYAVVGFEPPSRYQMTKQLAMTLALRLDPRLLYGEATNVFDGAVETMKLRGGLLNKVQAHLLADHLNQLHNDSHRHWLVVEGPAPDSNSRTWLDAFGPVAPLLRRESGVTAAWNLGPVAQREIATYRLERGLVVSPSQVFSLQSPRVIVPPRFVLGCQLSPHFDLPADGTAGIAARRDEPCEKARALCELITDTNLEDDVDWDGLANLRIGFTDGVKGFIYNQENGIYDDPAYAYSFGFDEREAELAVRHLHGSEFGEFVPVRIGEGGRFNPLYFLDCARELSVTNVDGLTCGIEVFCYRM